MILIRPKTINDAALTSSNIAEGVPAAWAADTTYGANDQVAVIASSVITNSANTTVTSLGAGVYTIEKTSGGSAYNAAAVSAANIGGDFVLRIKILAGAGSGSFFGLSSNPTSAIDTNIDRAWQFQTGNAWRGYEAGSIVVASTGLVTDYAWIWRAGTSLGYGHGATLAAAQASPDRTVTSIATLGFDSALLNVGDKIEVLLSYVATGATPVPLYRSLQAANLNHDPASSPTWWIANGFVYPAWAATTIYALAAMVTVAHRLYESLSGGTSAAVTMTIASPCVVSWTAHGLAANTPITFTTSGALPTGLTAGTVYYVLSPTTNSFNVSATSGGAAINTSGSQSGTHTAIANPNLNKAITDPAFWLDIGPSNRWAMFDSYNGTATTDAELIDVTMNITGRADSLALLSLASAVSARVTASTVADGTLYDMSYPLTSTDGISSWYAWFFEEIERKTNLLLTDLPTNLNPTVRVILTGTGTSTMECGNLVVGQQKDLGRTLHDSAQVGIIDYSRKDVDDFGNYTIVERAFSKRGSFRMRIAKAQVDGIHETLSVFRATPAVYSATADYGSTLIFGFFRSFDIAIDYPLESLVSIEIEGLT